MVLGVKRVSRLVCGFSSGAWGGRNESRRLLESSRTSIRGTSRCHRRTRPRGERRRRPPRGLRPKAVRGTLAAWVVCFSQQTEYSFQSGWFKLQNIRMCLTEGTTLTLSSETRRRRLQPACLRAQHEPNVHFQTHSTQTTQNTHRF